MSSKFQAKVKKQYQKDGYCVNKFETTKNGYPDLICTKQGEADIYIECKEVKDILKPLQKFRIDELNKSGKIAFCLQDGKGIIYPTNKSFNDIHLDF